LGVVKWIHNTIEEFFELECNLYNESQEEYDKMVRKLEEEVRNHIRIEQQLKLCIETLQEKIELLIKENEKLNFLQEVVVIKYNRS